MKINVKSTFQPIETIIDVTGTTLRDILSELSKNYAIIGECEFFDNKNREVYPGCEVLVNEQSYQGLPDGLDMKLKAGDKLEIIPFIMVEGG
ncbi:MoaD/ThiS family protein [Chloroflexota bacterium]